MSVSTTQSQPPPLPLLHSLKNRVEFGDLLLFFYFLVVVRQWFWPLNNSAAWLATIPLALVCWVFYELSKDEVAPRSTTWFWLIVGLPLLLVFALRFPFPDTSFDVWSLRLFHGERGLRGFLYWPNEFFPTAAPFNPTPDMLTGVFRHALGYRLGTILNLLVLLWTATVIERLLRSWVVNEKWRAVFVLVVVSAEQVLFEINNYMPDLLALPLLLEATRLTLSKNHSWKTLLHVALFLGLAVGLKLSNGAVAMPLAIIWVWRVFTNRPFNTKQVVLNSGLACGLFFAPFVGFLIWVYKLTGNPIFPLYNKLFQSPLYPPFNGWDNRWGGYGAWEIFAWPVLMFFEPVRTSELPVYSGRLSVGFVASLICLFFFRRLETPVRLMICVLLVGTWLWSLTMGYIRYGLYLEVLSGILLIVLMTKLFTTKVFHWKSAIALCVALILVVQVFMSGVYVLRTEWSLRPTIFDDFTGYQREAKYLFTDRSIRRLLSQDELHAFDQVDVWIVSGIKTSGLIQFLNDRAPCISVRFAGLLLAEANRDSLSRTLEASRGKRMWSLVLKPDYNDAVASLRESGLDVVGIREFNLPFFSPENVVHTYFIQVEYDPSRKAKVERTRVESSLNAAGYNASLESVNSPASVTRERALTVFVRVTNSTGVKWTAFGSENGQYQIVMSGRWLKDNKQVGTVAETTLPYDFAPSESTVLPITLSPPGEIGKYVLQIDMMQRGAGSFAEKGSKPLEIPIDVK